jgi:transcriptional regulator with XRE-family HTH domain
MTDTPRATFSRVANNADPNVREVYECLADAVTELRTQRGLSQRALARRAGLSPSTVSRIERQQGPIRIDTLSALADALRVSVRRLLKQRPRVVH